MSSEEKQTQHLTISMNSVKLHVPDTPASGSDERETMSVMTRIALKKLSVFWTVKVAQLLCVVYIMVLTFSKAPIGLVDIETGKIIDVNSHENTENGVILVNGDYRPVVAATTFQMICLAISRMSAFSLYPVMIAVFITKCKATKSFFSRTPISMYTIQDSHELHSYAGKYIAFDVWLHTVFHLLRWAAQRNISLLWNSRCGLSGLIVVIATPFITFPMMYWKQSIPYELRKGLHYLFFLFAVGMCFHVPVTGIPNGGFIAPVLGSCICLYTLDAIYVTLFMTEKIETTTFQVLPSGVQMSMDVSEAFQKRGEQGGFAYVCLPWVDRNQWHAFSLFENPVAANKREVFMLNAGNWTQDVHKALQRDTVRPVWVQGPFESPYNNAISYDNQILVTTGIGITPALSVIRAHKESRRINLIWAVRDAAMLEFFMERLYLDHDGWNLIFYTGKTLLNPALEEMNTNVRVIKRRPDLQTLIPNIIYGIESGRGLPETYVPREMGRVTQLLNDRTRELDAINDMTISEKLKDLTGLAHEHGFLFTELIHHLEFDTGTMDLENITPKDRSVNSSTSDDANSQTASNDTDSSNLGEREILQKIKSLSESIDPSHSSIPSYLRSLSTESATTGDQNRGTSSLNLVRQSMRTLLTSAFKPWEENQEAKDYVKALEKDSVLPTWGILYCGGNANVESALKRISEEYHVALNAESFDW